MTMTRAERIDHLVECAIETTPATIEDDVLAMLPGIFGGLLDHMERWRDPSTPNDLPETLRMCQCSDCIVGVAGEVIRERTGRQQYGYSNALSR